MKRQERAFKIGTILDELYPAPPIPLVHRDPFTLLIAVLLSAQTTDAQVNKVTPALFERAATPHEMSQLEEHEILALIRSCGLSPSKARNIRKLSQILVEEHAGDVPRDIEALERLPGVGHKTASVVVAQAFGIPSFPVDTHIHRLAHRWRLSNGTTVEKTERDLKSVFPPDEWNRRHLQIIYFGREYCPARGHVPQECPVCSWASVKSASSPQRRRRL